MMTRDNFRMKPRADHEVSHKARGMDSSLTVQHIAKTTVQPRFTRDGVMLAVDGFN
jgi:hypothetical protein